MTNGEYSNKIQSIELLYANKFKNVYNINKIEENMKFQYWHIKKQET
jgi:hypothetical protein